MILIIGGGLAGLAAAYELSKNHKVLVLEKEKYAGGLAASFEKNGEFIPLAYHHIMLNDLSLLTLIRELQLEKYLIKTKAKIRFFWKGQFISLASPINLLFFKPLGFLSRIKLGLLGLKILLVKDWSKYDDITAKEWIEKNAGKDVYEKIFSPLLKSKFSSDADKISASWIGFRLAKKESGGNFSYLRGGIEFLIKTLEKKIEENQGRIIKNTELNKLDVHHINDVTYKSSTTVNIKPEKIISTLPIPVFLAILKKGGANPFNYLQNIKYKSTISCVIALNKKITPFYWINFLGEEADTLSFKAIFDHSNINPYVNEGNSILYLVTYLDNTDAFYKKNNREIFDTYINDLDTIFPGIITYIRWHRIFKLPYALPVYYAGYRRFCPKAKTPLDSVYFSGICLFPEMRNMGAAIESGKQVAKLLLNKQ